MWRITVRVFRSKEWLSIWSGEGPEVERDARTQFARVSRRLDGHETENDNVHADSWLAARLDGPDGTVDEYLRAPRPSDTMLTIRPGEDTHDSHE